MEQEETHPIGNYDIDSGYRKFNFLYLSFYNGDFILKAILFDNLVSELSNFL